MILFIIKLYARNNILKHIKNKSGYNLIKVVRDFEQKKTKFKILVANIAFIKLCKKAQLIPTFANVNASIRNRKYRLKRKVSRLVMQTELQNKHREKRKLRKDNQRIKFLLSTSLSVIAYNALLHQRNIAVKSQIKVIKLRHEQKSFIAWNWKKKQPTTLMDVNNPTLNRPYIMSHLTNEEYTTLSFGLDHHFPTKSKDVAIEVEFEQFCQRYWES